MSKIELLIATMKQDDFSFIEEMNIKSNIVIANQHQEFTYKEKIVNNYLYRMITTNTKGVGYNRNLALLNSNSEICLVADDDVIYVNDYNTIIEEAFSKLKNADIIIFNIETIGAEVGRRYNKKIKKVNIFNFQNYGAVRIAFRRSSIIRKNIWFSMLFGGGSIYSHGEDSLFLRESLSKKMKIYTYPKIIGSVYQNKSSWFTGYNEKYFYDKGALICAMFPKIKYFIGIIYYPIRFYMKTNLSYFQIIRYICKGINAYERLIEFK